MSLVAPRHPHRGVALLAFAQDAEPAAEDVFDGERGNGTSSDLEA